MDFVLVVETRTILNALVKDHEFKMRLYHDSTIGKPGKTIHPNGVFCTIVHFPGDTTPRERSKHQALIVHIYCITSKDKETEERIRENQQPVGASGPVWGERKCWGVPKIRSFA